MNRWLPLLIVQDIVIWAISGYVQMRGLMQWGSLFKDCLQREGGGEEEKIVKLKKGAD